MVWYCIQPQTSDHKTSLLDLPKILGTPGTEFQSYKNILMHVDIYVQEKAQWTF